MDLLKVTGLVLLLGCGRVSSHGGPDKTADQATAEGGADAASESSDAAGAPVTTAGGAPPTLVESGGALGSAAAGGAPPTPAEAGEGGAAGAPSAHPCGALQVVTGRLHSCALLEDHRVKCWGQNLSGALGLGLGEEARRGADPALMGDALPAVDLGAARTTLGLFGGGSCTCAALDDDEVKCWGDCPLNSSNNGTSPAQMGDALPALKVKASAIRSLSMGCVESPFIALNDGRLFRLPDWYEFPLGDGAKLVSLVPGAGGLCLFDDGRLRTSNGNYPLGYIDQRVTLATANCAYDSSSLAYYLDDATLHCSGQAYPAPGLTALGYAREACGITGAGSVRCWYSAASTREAPRWSTPEADGYSIHFASPARAISTGADEHLCVLLESGAVQCWSSTEHHFDPVGWDDTSFAQPQPVNLGGCR